jgi:hypothetical protein
MEIHMDDIRQVEFQMDDIRQIEFTVKLPPLEHFKKLCSVECFDSAFPVVSQHSFSSLKHIYITITEHQSSFMDWVDLLQGCPELWSLDFNPRYVSKYAPQVIKAFLKYPVSTQLETISLYMFDVEWCPLLEQFLELFCGCLKSLGLEMFEDIG